MGPPFMTLTTFVSILTIALSPLHAHSSSPPLTVAPISITSLPSKNNGWPSQPLKVLHKTSERTEMHGDTSPPQPQHHHSPSTSAPHHHHHHHQRKHLVHGSPSPPKINVGKKIGILFLGVAGALQVAVVGFLGFKRWQISRIEDRFGEFAV